ncbi:MAG: invasion associated locus B family protein [Pseudomonadota bacterium]|nr:invasion associated locus B family protein [Pseudomonadota bacterium]
MRGLISILSSLALVVLAGQAYAQSARQVAKHGDWATYSYQAQNGKVCYVLTVPKPKSMRPANVDHGDIFFFVRQRPGQAVSLEPQFIAGYTLREGSKVSVSVGSKDFTMFTKGKSAWVENAAEEPQLIAAMKGGADMQLTAQSSRGTKTSYTFSLSGITAALDAIAGCK